VLIHSLEISQTIKRCNAKSAIAKAFGGHSALKSGMVMTVATVTPPVISYLFGLLKLLN